MVDGFLAGLFVAFFGSAVGALLGQFLSFYRQSINDIEKLTSIIDMIGNLDETRIIATAQYPDAPIWQLRDKLYTAFSSCYGSLDADSKEKVEDLLHHIDDLKSFSQTAGLNNPPAKNLDMPTESALEEIEQIGWSECLRMFFLPSRRE